MEVGALNDRHAVVIPKAQVGFINFIALPLWKAWGEYVSPGVQTIQLRHLEDNLNHWKSKIEGESGCVRLHGTRSAVHQTVHHWFNSCC